MTGIPRAAMFAGFEAEYVKMPVCFILAKRIRGAVAVVATAPSLLFESVCEEG